MIPISVKRGKMTSERAKPGTKNSMRNPRITLRPSIIANTVSIAQISLHYQYAGSRLSFRYIKSHMLGLRKPFLYTNTAHKRAGLHNPLLRILKSGY
jgi:hypothetical protein